MKKTRTLFTTFKLSAVSTLAAVMLAACGGGGGSSDGSSSSSSANPPPTTTPTTTVSASIISPAANQIALPSPSGNPAADGVAYLNAIRHNVGLSTTLVNDPGLMTASLHHATYLVDNQTYGHYETQGQPGFTGADPTTRIMAQGNYSATGEVVVAGAPGAFTSSITPVQTLFDAPYHRLIMLDDFQAMGVASDGTANWEAFNIDFGNEANSLASTAIVTYPYPGQTNVPTYWFANESPNPFASAPQYEQTDVGYPATFESGFMGVLSSVSFTLTDSGGNVTSCLVVSPDTNPADLSNGAMCIPYKVLSPNTTYTAHATGVLTSMGQAHPIDITWHYTTGSAVPQAAGVVGAPTNRQLPQFGDLKPVQVRP